MKPHIFRFIFTVIIVIGVFYETGPFTATAIGLIALAIEGLMIMIGTYAKLIVAHINTHENKDSLGT